MLHDIRSPESIMPTAPAMLSRTVEAATDVTRMIERALLEKHRFGPFHLAVDIGGGEGSLLCGLLARHPEAQGIVFDRPGVVEAPDAAWRTSAEAPRIRAWPGDFFRNVPPGDLYLLKSVLNAWTDAECRVILRNIRAAARHDARVAIAEMVLVAHAAPRPAYLKGVNMMTGGRERSASEYAALLKSAGFKLDRVTALPSHYSVLEAIAV